MDVFCENIKTGVTVPIKLGKMLNIPVADIHAYDVKYYDGILVFSSWQGKKESIPVRKIKRL